MQWNASHAHAYVNSSLCGSIETAYGVAGGTGWDTGNINPPSSSSTQRAGGETGSESLLIGAWRGAPDGSGANELGGYYKGLVDNLEVRGRGIAGTYRERMELGRRSYSYWRSNLLQEKCRDVYWH